MKILNENNIEIVNPDLSVGFLKEEHVFVMHHEAVEEIKEQGHYEIIAEYPNGGKDIEWIVDVEGIDAQDAWDEYEDIYRYILYTEEELSKIEEERNKPSSEERIDVLEAENAELKCEIEMLIGCVLEMSEIIYA